MKRLLAVIMVFLLMFSITNYQSYANEGNSRKIGITFDLDGGNVPDGSSDVFNDTETANSYENGQYIPGSEFGFLSDVIPVKEGYRFVGWSCIRYEADGNFFLEDSEPVDPTRIWIDEEDGQLVYIDEGVSYIELTAIWEEPRKIGITFDLDGGNAPDDFLDIFNDTETANTYVSRQYIPGSEFGFMSEAIPVKEGYAFKGWSCDKYDYEGNAFFKPFEPNSFSLNVEDEELIFIDEGVSYIKLTAIWEEYRKIGIKFNPDGGSAPDDFPDMFNDRETMDSYVSEQYIPGSEFSFLSEAVPVKEGYRFVGWSYESYINDECIHFQPVSFLLNVEDQELIYIDEGVSHIKLTPRWEEPRKIDITFDLDGGSAPDDFPNMFNDRETMNSYVSGDYIPGSEFSFLSDVIPVKEGYRFTGWSYKFYDNQDDVILELDSSWFDEEDPQLFRVNEDFSYIKLAATWEESRKIGIKFNLDGGSAPDDFPDVFNDTETSNSYKNGEYIPGSEFSFMSEATPLKEGYRFTGWSYKDYNNQDDVIWESDYLWFDVENPEMLYIEEGTSYIELTATWEDVKQIGIKFNLDGGSAPDDFPDVFSDTITKGFYRKGDWISSEEFDFFNNIKPEKEGSYFRGWLLSFYDSDGNVLNENNEYLWDHYDEYYEFDDIAYMLFTATWVEGSPGLNQSEEGIFYIDEEGNILKGQYKEIDGDTYYFQHNGYALTNSFEPFYVTEATKRYFGNDGRAVKGWKKIDSKWYFFDLEDGYSYHGFKEINGNTFFFDYQLGNMITGWMHLKQGKEYKGWWYFNESGYMATAWKKIGDKWYYFDTTGHMETGWKKIDGTWYYLNSSGAMATGWKEVNGKWYYFNGSGYMQTGWQQIDGTWYYLNSSGDMVTGWKEVNGKWYYFNGSGYMQTGWQQIDGTWYYLNASGDMVTGWKEINDKWYYFNGSGYMQTGWQEINGTWYYLNSSGEMVTGWKEINDKWYYFNGSGYMQTGWQQIDGTWYQFASDGHWIEN